MIFPNAFMSFAGLSAASPITDYAGGWAAVFPHYEGSEPSGVHFGVVEACTATDQEIEDRSAGGEFSFDVIDEHMTRLWFHDRDSFRLAWRLARQICGGWMLSGVKAGEIEGVSAAGSQQGGRYEIARAPGLWVEASAHHIAEAA